MHHVGAAVFLAQPVVGRASVDQDGVAALERAGKRQNGCGRSVDDNEFGAGIDLGRDGRDEGLGFGILDYFQRVILVEKAPGGVVVVDGKLAAGKAIVGRGLVEQR